jgi:adenosylmethionine-8-amino-7-oxononanoate aminotransferase
MLYSSSNNNDENRFTSMNHQQILELDRKHVWHPYAAMPGIVENVPIVSARGVHLYTPNPDSDGGCGSETLELVDGMSSWWACIHGYNHPVLNAAIKNQLDSMAHVMFGGLTHQPAVALATKLVQMTSLPHVFFCDSGSVSVEVAMKMAQQYQYNLGKPSKNRFLTVRGGYHGDTFQAMSVCDPITGMHHLFQTVLQQQLFANVPTPAYGQVFDEARDMQSIKELLHRHHPEIAGIILEPIVQGAGGMRFYAPEYLQKVRELCDEYEVLLIADEIATGFGRSGKLFALQHANITPDILCLGKALSGGYMSFAATLTTSHVAEVFRKGEAGVLMHGPTFMGNPLACAVSLASLNLLETATDWQRKVPAIERQLRQELEPCRESEYVRDVRVLGAIGVVELKEPVADMKTLQRDLVQHGVWLRPFGRLLYTMPPFIIEPHQLRKITRAMVNLTRRRL